ncbi:MAG TPA: aminotransferase class I/II-fold pyridoxal phosphate-dependent enzyme, partial [Chthoniobacterales bacterium]|nr:aminotransferase class I/II-fold pyridoxal phosphate-dependent enzyme [Chthoniobacterales bacterium]
MSIILLIVAIWGGHDLYVRWQEKRLVRRLLQHVRFAMSARVGMLSFCVLSSKIHGLATLRIGYGVARPDLIEVLQKTRQPFNVNGIAQVGALAALQ